MAKPLTITVLGAGSVLYPQRAWSSFVLGGTLLLDAPPGLTMALQQSGTDPLVLDTICISHFHGDHFAGLPFLLLEYDAIRGRTQPLTIIGPPGIQATIEALYDLYYPGFPAREKRYGLTYLEVADGRTLTIQNGSITAYAMNHARGTVQAFGYRVTYESHVVAYTGDTAWSEAIFDLAAGAEALIIDCAYEHGQRPEHLSLDEIRLIRNQLPDSICILLTHLGGAFVVDDLPNVQIPHDYQTITICSRSGEP